MIPVSQVIPVTEAGAKLSHCNGEVHLQFFLLFLHHGLLQLSSSDRFNPGLLGKKVRCLLKLQLGKTLESPAGSTFLDPAAAVW